MIEPGSAASVLRYVYVTDMHEMGLLLSSRLQSLCERHRIRLDRPAIRSGANILDEVAENEAAGVVIEMKRGWPNRRDLILARRLLRAGVSFFFYWPLEEAIEVVDRHRFRSLVRLFLYATAYRLFRFLQLRDRLNDFETRHQARLDAIRENTRPARLPDIGPEDRAPRINGMGVYLRTDYWADIRAGGSYGHTCYLAKELARRCESFFCVMGSRFELLDDIGLRQIVLERPAPSANETDMLAANPIFYDRLKVAMEVARPAFIYERLVPGNYTGARLCQDLDIPYLVEYNGSEIVMRRVFGDGKGYRHEDLFVAAEQAAFEQATAISVVSEAIRENLIEAGVDARKILVNPNCADPDAYAPGSVDDVASLRDEVGWNDGHVVIGFVGTFGGWHGIEVLANALPRIAAEVPEARFLLVGKGNLQDHVIKSLDAHGLRDRVHMTGMLPQLDAARLMKMCDILVSPHHRNMGTMKFFGSPTKVFEYMAMGAGIVASDLEQIGEVLSPALRPGDLLGDDVSVSNQRAVLCRPGDVDEFVSAVIGLARRPDVAKALGANARRAVLDTYSWSRHVDRFLDFVRGLDESLFAEPALDTAAKTPYRHTNVDPFKRAIIDQWDNDPCGSHYATAEGKSRRQWFEEVEHFRHQEFAPWMPKLMEFDSHAGEKVLEIGAGMGTDLARFAAAGALVTDLDMSSGHLDLAHENLSLRSLTGEFVRGDAEAMPFDDETFDVVYANGVIHHTPNTARLIDEIHRVLKPGGTVICMVYAENSIQYWRDLVLWRGLRRGQLLEWSIGEIMSRSVEISATSARPLVKVYRSEQLKEMFRAFNDQRVFHRQLMPHEPPKLLRWLPVSALQRIMGWNLVIKARKYAS